MSILCLLEVFYRYLIPIFFNDYGRSYGLSDHMIDFCVGKVFMVLLETKKTFLKLTKCPWVEKKYIPNEQRFIFWLETNNVSLC